jgi:hypothetical protein
MKVTVISHFYNEEFLLPYWLDHNLRIFDHGVMIDYDSTDSSCDIIRTLAPNWEIRRSKNHEFDYLLVDKEVMEVEETVTEWKMVLNTTEFIVIGNLKFLLTKLQEAGHHSLRTTGMGIIDVAEEKPLSSEPLIFQRFHGEKNISRMRVIHEHSNGQYFPGRHDSYLGPLRCPHFFCCWFGWCPYPQVKQRRLQIKTRIPPKILNDPVLGVPHSFTSEDLDIFFTEESKKAVYLPTVYPEYRSELVQMAKRYFPEVKFTLDGCDL